ncbi:MAG: hypothetical protein ACTSP6_10075 [Promethearchaeota archaeon]
MSEVIIAGGGQFGLKAIDFIKEKNLKTVLIDSNPKCFAAEFASKKFDNLEDFNLNLNDLKDGEIFFLNTDILIVLDLIEELNPTYIIPVVPIHLMASFIISFLLKYSINLTPNNNLTKDFLKNIDPELLLNQMNEEGVVYLSYAKIDEICPDNCSGPISYCPNFKREKPQTVTQYLKSYYGTSNSFNIRKKEISEIIIINESYQLMPGLGGLKGNDIRDILKVLRDNMDFLSHQKFDMVIATTCNCHGVINFYKDY